MNNRISVVILLLLISFSVFKNLTPENIVFTEDISLSFAVADHILDGGTLVLGPPSHIGGRHLGPIGYWYAVLALWLGGGTYGAILVLSALEILAFFAIALLARKISDQTNWWATIGVLLTALAVQYNYILRIPWQNHFTLVMSILFLFGSYSVLKNGWRSFSFFLLSSSLLVQFHYSTIPFVAGMGLVVIYVLFSSQRKKASEILSLFLSPYSLILLALTTLSWIPLIRYELFYGGTLYAHFTNHLSEKNAAIGIYGALSEFVYFIKKFSIGDNSFLSFFGKYNLIAQSIAIILTIFTGYQFLKRRSGPELRFIIGLSISTIFLVVALSRVAPPFYPSYLYGLLPLPALIIGILVYQTHLNLQSSSNIVLTCSTFFALILSAIILRNGYFALIPRDSYVTEYHSLKHVDDVAKIINADRKELPTLISAKSASRFLQGPYYYQLGRDHYPLMSYWDWMPELPQIDKKTINLNYLIACPKPEGTYRKQINKDFENEGWIFDYNLDLSLCPSCSKCVIRRFHKEKN